jgi:hypothetical protein
LLLCIFPFLKLVNRGSADQAATGPLREIRWTRPYKYKSLPQEIASLRSQ